MTKEKQKKTLADNVEGKVQWHPAFYAATRLEFLEYRSFLDYDEELFFRENAVTGRSDH